MISKFFRRLDPWSAIIIGIVLLIVGGIAVIFGAYQAGAALAMLGLGSVMLAGVIGVAREVDSDWKVQ